MKPQQQKNQYVSTYTKPLLLVRSHFTPQMAGESDKLKYKYIYIYMYIYNVFFCSWKHNINDMNAIESGLHLHTESFLDL